MMKEILLEFRPKALTLTLCGVLLWLSSPFSLSAQVNSGAELADAWRATVSEELDQYASMLRSERPAAEAPLIEARWKSDQTPVWQAEPGLLGTRDASDPDWFASTVNAVLRTYGLPEGLVAVAAVESGFNPYALSPKGARGLWQLMPETARRFGLVVDATHDERLDPLKSTRAAAQYLRQLYAQFGDWRLALAAYDAGENRVQRTVKRNHTRDFWSLSEPLPEETRRYVPAVLALAGTNLLSEDIATARSFGSESVRRFLRNGASVGTRVIFAEGAPRDSALSRAN